MRQFGSGTAAHAANHPPTLVRRWQNHAGAEPFRAPTVSSGGWERLRLAGLTGLMGLVSHSPSPPNAFTYRLSLHPSAMPINENAAKYVRVRRTIEDQAHQAQLTIYTHRLALPVEGLNSFKTLARRWRAPARQGWTRSSPSRGMAVQVAAALLTAATSCLASIRSSIDSS
jgi:hypothetical protein